jgi:flagellar biosynthesis component FlhA
LNIQETYLGDELETNGTVEAEDNLSSISDSLFCIPGLPFLIASVCIVFALIAAYFVKDIKKGRVGDEESSEESGEASSTSNSQSESESQTKVNIKSSVTDVQEFVEVADVRNNLRKC